MKTFKQKTPFLISSKCARHYSEWVEKTSEMSPESMTKTIIIHIVEKLETKPEF